MAEWQVERLDRTHRRDQFECGQPSLDEFLRSLVSQYEKRNLGRTYVAVTRGERLVCGYYTLASGALGFEVLPAMQARKLPRHPVPVVLIARLAVDRASQGKRLGETLLLDALARTLQLSDKLGIHAVVVDAIDQHAKAFYQKYGFIPLLDRGLHLFLPVDTLRRLYGSTKA